MKTDIQNDANDSLFRIFSSLLENKPIITDHIHLKSNFYRTEICLKTYQSELQKFLEDCYKIKVPVTPNLMLGYNNNDTDEQTNDLLLATMNDTMKKILATKENEHQHYDNNRHPKEHNKGLVDIPEERTMSFGSDVERNEEEEIKNKRKERKKKKQYKTGYRQNAISQRKPVPVNQSDTSKFKTENCDQDEFVSTVASLGSTSTFFHDATSVLPSRKVENKQSEEECNSSKAPSKEDMDLSFVSRKSITPKRKLEKSTNIDTCDKMDVSCLTTQPNTTCERSKASNYVIPPQAERSKNESYKKKRPIFRRAKRPFTFEEMDAIKNGVQKYGAGKWKEIKDEYNNILRDRTTVNIKVTCKLLI